MVTAACEEVMTAHPTGGAFARPVEPFGGSCAAPGADCGHNGVRGDSDSTHRPGLRGPVPSDPGSWAGDPAQHGRGRNHGVAVQRADVLRGAVRVLLHASAATCRSCGTSAPPTLNVPFALVQHHGPRRLVGLVPARRAAGRARACRRRTGSLAATIRGVGHARVVRPHLRLRRHLHRRPGLRVRPPRPRGHHALARRLRLGLLPRHRLPRHARHRRPHRVPAHHRPHLHHPPLLATPRPPARSSPPTTGTSSTSCGSPCSP